MPELPEVEVTRRTVAPPIFGARVLAARLGKPLRWPLGVPEQHLVGRHVGEVGRRGKYLWLPLGPRAVHDSGHGPGRGADSSAACAAGKLASAAAACAAADAGGLLMHLGMSGSLGFSADVGEPGPHDHFDLVTTAGTLRLHDPRRFGAVLWSPSLNDLPAAKLLASLGPEPFDPALTPQSFHAALRQRRSAIKSVLLSGDVVVGAGNIYACEALFEAGIDPRTRACAISRPRAERLLKAVRRTLLRAMELGGSTLRDYRDAHGASGAYQSQAAVYGRQGEACKRCGMSLRRIVQGQRATYFCAACQRR